METNNKTMFITIKGLALKYEITKDNPINTSDSQSYFEWIEKVDILPFDKGIIRFSSNIWDFSEYTSLNICKKELRLNFSYCPDCYKRILKQYALSLLIDNKLKIQSIQKVIKDLRICFCYFHNHNIDSLEDIKAQDIKLFFIYLMGKNISSLTVDHYRIYLRNIFLFYEANMSYILNKDLKEVLCYSNIQSKKVYKENHKTKIIPNTHFNNLVSALIKYIDNPLIPYGLKGTAALYLLLSQTGLRISELLFISIKDSLKECTTITGETVYYLYYDSWKGYSGNNTSNKAFTYINKIAKKAYDTLLNMPEYIQRRKEWNVNFLYCGTSRTKKSELPINAEIFNHAICSLMIDLDNQNLIHTINVTKEEYPYFDICNLYRTKISKRTGETIKTVGIFYSQRFRFTVCTQLYEKGVPITYIQRFMNHLTKTMTFYHINSDNKIQEDLEISKDILRGIVTGDTKIIEYDKGLSENIQKFIAENNYNVEKDLETIISKLAENIPIRVKTGGVCIKSSKFRSCAIDSKTDAIMCSYSVCPNIFHFFYHCGITWRKYEELKEAIKINEERGFLKQVCKDKNNLQTIIKTQLLPQMDELKIQLEKKGSEYIKERYTDLIPVIDNFDKIRMEAIEWTKNL